MSSIGNPPPTSDDPSNWLDVDPPHSRVAAIRSGYSFLKDKDVANVLALFDDDVEVVDPFYSTVARGKEEMLELWSKREVVTHSVVIGSIIEMGDAVLAVVHHDFYDQNRGRLGPGVAEVHRFIFREHRIIRLEITTLDDVPDEVRGLLG